MTRHNLAPFPSAILGLLLIAITSGVATIPNGWQRKVPTKGTSEPQSIFYECWLIPWLSWCQRPADPKPFVPPPDVPECGTFEGPCQ